MTTETDYRLRHLEMIQAVINRFAQNSFAIKDWSVTVVSIIFKFLNTQARRHTTMAFWPRFRPAFSGDSMLTI